MNLCYWPADRSTIALSVSEGMRVGKKSFDGIRINADKAYSGFDAIRINPDKANTNLTDVFSLAVSPIFHLFVYASK